MSQTVTVSMGESDDAPWVFHDFENSTVETHGIVIDTVDLFVSTANRKLGLNLEYKLVTTPRKRIDSLIANGDICVNLISNPSWYPLPSSQFARKPWITNYDDVLITKATVDDIYNLDQLHYREISGILGYVYPTLTSTVDLGLIKIHDVAKHDAGIGMVTLNRVYGHVIEKHVANWLLRNNTDLKIHPIKIGAASLFFVYSHECSKSIKPYFDQLHDEIINGKEFKAILLKYNN